MLELRFKCLALLHPALSHLSSGLIDLYFDRYLNEASGGCLWQCRPLSLSWIHLLTKKAFKKLESWGFSWNIWSINSAPFKFIP